MHCGKKWWIREFVAPYIFPLNPEYVAARSLRSLRRISSFLANFLVTKYLLNLDKTEILWASGTCEIVDFLTKKILLKWS